MLKTILVMMLALMSSNVMAVWIVVGDTDSGTTYADPTTIRRAGDRVKLWYLSNLTTADTTISGVAPFMSAKTQAEFDCNEVQQRILYISFFSDNMAEGKILFSESLIGNWLPVPPGSLYEALWKIACGKL